MTTYYTQNPLGSSDPRDLYDNAENLDNFVNGAQSAYDDRLGQARKSWAGMEQDFADFLASSGYQFIGDYAGGIEVTAYNQVIRDGGEFWRLSGSTTLPYTTTGSGMPEGGAFVVVGDAVLRQELAGDPADGLGAALVNGVGQSVKTRAEMKTIDAPDGYQFSLSEGDRSGLFVVKSGSPPYADPSEGWYIILNNGRYAERDKKYPIHVGHFGAIGDRVNDDSPPIQSAVDFALPLLGAGNKGMRIAFNPSKSYLIKSTINVTKSEIEFFSPGRCNLDVQVPAGQYAINVDLSGLSGASSRPFYMTNVCLIDTSGSKTRRGIKTTAVQSGAFTNVDFLSLEWAVDPHTDSNLNVFDKCRWENNIKGYYHLSANGAANNNSFISPIFMTCEAPYYVESNGNTFLGGDFEPANGVPSAPVIVTGDREVWEGVRIERNQNNTEWLRVGSDCVMTVSFHATGAGQPNPAVNFSGKRSKVTVNRTLATQLAHFDTLSEGNQLEVLDHSPLTSFLWIDDKGESNSVKTPYGTSSKSVLSPTVAVNLIDPDLGTWVKSDMTVSTVPEGYQLLSTGAGAYIEYALTGTFENLFVSMTGHHVNPPGDIKVYVDSDATNKLILEQEVAKKHCAFKGTYTNPVVKISMDVAAGAGAAAVIKNVTVSEKMISAGKLFLVN